MSEKRSGKTNLQELITDMEPVLHEGEYVFVSVADRNIVPRELTICEMMEKEGYTFVLTKGEALRLGLSFDLVMAWITLNVHSSLAAVGLTAAFSTTLGQHNISCNVIAGFYHDHIFVRQADAQRALKALQQMTVKQ